LGQLLQEYKWVNLTRVGTDERNRAFFFEYSGRTKIFFFAHLDKMVSGIIFSLRQLGMENIPILRDQSITDIISYRNGVYDIIPPAVSIFDVNKLSKRYVRPVPRRMHVSEDSIIEKDSSSFLNVGFRKISSIYAIIRYWSSPREFSLEFNDGSSRSYTCAVRDTLLAMLLDVCHANGNVRVIVTGEVSDGLRLMPRFADEEYKSTLADAFFGVSSIEAWFLNRLAKVCVSLDKVHLDCDAIEQGIFL
jgi:hypothetical protein